MPCRGEYGYAISFRCRRIETLLLSRCCLVAQLLRLTRRLEVGLGMLYDISLRIPSDRRCGLDVLDLCNHVATGRVDKNYLYVRGRIRM
jgi:hypothetical protein